MYPSWQREIYPPGEKLCTGEETMLLNLWSNNCSTVYSRNIHQLSVIHISLNDHLGHLVVVKPKEHSGLEQNFCIDTTL